MGLFFSRRGAVVQRLIPKTIHPEKSSWNPDDGEIGVYE
jgi:hypothetical protein